MAKWRALRFACPAFFERIPRRIAAQTPFRAAMDATGFGRRSRHNVSIARRELAAEELEQRQLLAGLPVITEFMARNDGFFEDGDGNAPDWIEIQNVGDAALDLSGYRLTDTSGNMSRWVFPSLRVDPGDYLIVFASGQESAGYVDAGGSLHTNFALSASGEYLALVAPDGSVLSQFGTPQVDYPPQRANMSYGMAQRTILVDGQSDAVFWVPLGEQVDSVWMQNQFDALGSGFTAGKAAIGFENDPGARTNFTQEIHTPLPPGSHAVYARIEFDLKDVSQVARLTLGMKYDNGFVAYLNGVKVAEANAPSHAQWFVTAPLRTPSDRDALEFEDFDVTDHIAQLVNGTNVLAIHGLNNINDREDMLLVPQLVASRNSPAAKFGYMPTPTPGTENVSQKEVFSDIVGAAQFSAQTGFFQQPFEVSITSPTAGSTIRFTTDGRPPTDTTGTQYTGPIRVTTTTTLRAAVFKDDHAPSQVQTHTYLFLGDVIRQPAAPPGYPTRWPLSADYEMDPDVVNDPAYRDQIIDGLKSLRTMSIVMDPDDLFGPRGIYTNTQLRGLAAERPVSLEIFNPDGSLAYQTSAGIRIHGNSTRDLSNTRKQSFRLTFRDQYGSTKLNYPLFPDAPIVEFDNIVLHAGKFNIDTSLIDHAFGRDTARDMGKVDAHATFVHLYLNGLYWGVYNPFERQDAQFAEAYFGGRDDDYDSVLGSGTGEAIDGDTRRYNELMRLIQSGLSTPEDYRELERQADLDSLIDFLLINQYTAHGEHELRAIGSRVGDPNFRFFLWDLDEGGLGSPNGRSDIASYFPAGVYDRLRRHPEFQMRYADRAHKHLTNGGALTPAAAANRWESRAQEIFTAVIAESARWGDMARSRPVTRDVEWQRERTQLLERFFPRRTQVLIDQLRASGIYPDIDAPVFNQHGGPVRPDFSLTMTHPHSSGIILFTLNGTDPRQPGGAVASDAQIYDGFPVPIAADAVVKARVFTAGEWSALNEAEFFVVGPDSPLHLRITELNYNPHSANPVAGLGEASVERDQFQFVELANTGQQSIDIGGVELARGIKFTFPIGTTLAPGKRVLVVKNPAAFESRYGAGHPVAGQFETDSLLSGRGLIELRDGVGRPIQSISYDTKEPWPLRANGHASSLEIVDPLGPGSDPTNWRSSAQFGGSPGAAGLEPAQPMALTEVLAHSPVPAADMLELFNTTSATIDISNWYISNSEDDYFKYLIPAGTSVPAGGYHVFTEQHLGFGFSSSHGDQVWLVQADAQGKPLRFVDHIQFGPSGKGISLGPIADGTWLPTAEPTFGGQNAALLMGDVIISEIHYAPVDPDGDGRQLKADDFEYLELYNRTSTTVDLAGWRLTGDIDLTLGAGTRIGPHETLVVVPFDSADQRKAAIFRVIHEMDASVAMVGPYAGKLPDNRAVVRLARPDQPPADQPAFTPYLYVDEVHYSNTAPWPSEAAGSGASLTRAFPPGYGSFSASWTAAAATPGSVDLAARKVGDANEDGQFDRLDIVQVLEGGKYLTGAPATWSQGDWNRDGLFDQQDIVAVLQAGSYRDRTVTNLEDRDAAFAEMGA